MIIVFTGSCLNPFRNIVHPHQDIRVTKRHWERSHEVNTPNIKKINYKDGVHGHLVSFCKLPESLASITTPTHDVGIFEKRWPSKP